jgi:serine/threonine protein kinase
LNDGIAAKLIPRFVMFVLLQRIHLSSNNYIMSLATLLIGKRPPTLEELEVVGSGASASSVVRAVVRDAGGFSKLSRGQVIAIKKVYVPRHSVIQMQRIHRDTARKQQTEQQRQNIDAIDIIEEDIWDDVAPDENNADAPSTSQEAFSTISASGSEENRQCDSQDMRRCDAIEREVSLLKSLHHPHIVSCFGVTSLQDRNMLGILMEYCGGNSLRHYYRRRQQQHDDDTAAMLPRHPGLPEETIRSFTAQMLHGLHYLHSNGVVHRDLKGLNVLLSEDLQTCKLADFGSATQIALAGSDARFHSMQGTIWWMSPEQFLLGKAGSGKEHCVDGTGGTFVADIWSLGCTVLELALGAIPFTHVSGGQFGLMLLLTRPTFREEDLLPPSVVSMVPPKVMEFVRRCLVRDPNHRPTAEQLLGDGWIQSAVMPSPRLSRNQSAAMSRQVSNSLDSSEEPSAASKASPVTTTTATNTITTLVVPDGIPEKLHSAVLFWHNCVNSFDGSISIRDLFSHMKATSLSDIIAPLFTFPCSGGGGGASPSLVTTASHSITFATYLMFMSYFGPFDTFMMDVWALEAEEYACVGYSSYSAYADYERTDSSHLLLSALSKPYVKLSISQGLVEEELKHAVTGTFIIRFSSKCMESPGSLTLSVKGDHGVLHYRITRPADGWGFFVVLPTKKSSRVGGDTSATNQRERPHLINKALQQQQRQEDIALLLGNKPGSSSSTAGGPSPPLCFDTIEDLVKYFSFHGIPNLRGDKTHKLLIHSS